MAASWNSVGRKLWGRRERKPGRRRRARSLRVLLEALEGRRMLAVLPTPSVVNHLDISGGGGGVDQSSPSIAYDPTNPQNLVTVFTSNDPNASGTQKVFVRGRYSTNGGTNWTSFTIPGNITDPVNSTATNTVPYLRATDANVAFDRNGTFYVVYSEHSANFDSGAIVMQKYSFTGNVPVLDTTLRNVNLNQWGLADAAYSPTLAVDNNLPIFTDPDTGDVQQDPYSGNIYVAWASDDEPPVNHPPLASVSPYNRNTLRMMASSDGGQTFSAPMIWNSNAHVGGTGTDQVAAPRIVISQGTTRVDPGSGDPIVAGGQVTVIWDDINSLRTASPPQDQIRSTYSNSGTEAFHFVDSTQHTISQGAATAGRLFRPAVTIDVHTPTDINNLPTAIVTGDFNDDGNLDAAVLSTGSSDASILLGNGDGTFAPATHFPAGAAPLAMEVGDFDGDTALDLIVVDSAGVNILFGFGDGTFTVPVQVYGSAGLAGVAVGNFDAGNTLDFAVADSVNGLVVVGLNSALTFTTATYPTQGLNPTAIAAARMDGGNSTDLVIANSGSDTISVLLNNGNGTFTDDPDWVFATGTNPHALAVGLMDSDQRNDVAVLCDGATDIFLNQTVGPTFNLVAGATLAPAAGEDPRDLLLLDVTADGANDLVFSNYGAGTVTIWVGNGQGAFTLLPGTFQVGTLPLGLAAGDFDGNARDDLMVANSGDDTVSLLLRRSDTLVPIDVSITDANFELTDLEVQLRLVHPDLREINIVLIAPNGLGRFTLLQNAVTAAGQAIVPAQGIAGTSMGYASLNPNRALDTVFSDQATRRINDSSAAPFIGRFLPEVGDFSTTLVGLDGASLSGTWFLQITDVVPFTGTTLPEQHLDEFGLRFTSATITDDGAERTVASTRVLGSLTGNFPRSSAAVPDRGIGPTIAIASDNTLGSFSQFQGRIYVAYTEWRDTSGNPSDNTDIFLASSDNGGVSWTVQGLVNDDDSSVDGFSEATGSSGRPQFMPSVAVDQTTGTLVMTWYDVRDNPARARVATYITTSIDGGDSFSKQTFVNSPQLITDAITSQVLNRGPIPDNQSAGNPSRETTFNFGDHQGLAVVAGHVYPVWSGNLNGGIHSDNDNLRQLLHIQMGAAIIAAGPRIVSSTMGVVSLPGDAINPAGANGPQFAAFEVEFDRPIDPSTFTPDMVTVLFRSASTPGNDPGTPIAVQDVQPLDFGTFGPALIEGATTFLVTLAQPQTAVGTYSYFINPDMSDRIRYDTSGGGATTTFSASGNQINRRVPPAGTGGSGIPANDITSSTIVISTAGATDTVVSMTLNLNIPHTWSEDLAITLTAPSGNFITLSAFNGTGDGVGYINTTFDDNATVDISSSDDPFTGTFIPDESLSTFVGESVNGTWLLTIEDAVGGDIGTLTNWSMTIVSSSGAVSTLTLGNKLDQDANATAGEPALAGTTIGDVYAIPTPTDPAAFTGNQIGTAVGPTINVSQGPGYEFDGVIAVDPTNPQRVFVTSQVGTTLGSGFFASYSTDGGATGTSRVLGDGSDGLPVAWTEPSVSWDQFGNLFMTYISAGNTQAPILLSTDGGQTFSVVSTVSIDDGSGLLDAFPTIVTGPTSLFGTGSIWVRFERGGNLYAVGASVTALGVVGAFGSPQLIPGSVGDNYGDIAIGPSGQVMVVWQDPVTTSGPSTLRYSVDSDGLGPAVFSPAVAVTTTNVGGLSHVPAQPNYRIDAQAGLAWDRNSGRVYLVYTDQAPLPSANTDILLRYSDNNGLTWSSAVKVNDDSTSNSQFLPRIAVDQTTGDIAVTWYDARNDDGLHGAGDSDGIVNDDVQLWGTISIDRGVQFFHNFQISQGTFNVSSLGLAADFGDHLGLAFESGIIHPLWVDTSLSPPGTELATAQVSVARLAAPGYFTAPFDRDTQPIIVPGPHVLSTSAISHNTFTATSTQLNLPIPAVGTGGTGTTNDFTGSTINASGITGTINRVTVNLTLADQADSELIIRLIAPNGRTVVLANLVAGANFIDTTFDDRATTLISAGTAPYTGSFKPQQALAALIGGQAAGTWTLQIQDTVSGNTGTLLDWSINLEVASNSGDDLVLNNTVNTMDVAFDRDMDASTFTTGSIIRIIGPTGLIADRATGLNIDQLTIQANPSGTDPDPLNPRTFRIGFPTQEINGTYVINLDSTIAAREKIPGHHDGDQLDNNLDAGLDNLRSSSTVTAPAKFDSTDIPKTIGSSKADTTSTSDITVSAGDNFVIAGLTVTLNITYANDPDLQAVLVAPDGTEILLFSGVGTAGTTKANFLNTVLDDAAATPIQSGSAPFFGTFNPTQPLGALIGKSSSGTWTLRITDSAAGRTGTLNNWSITFQKPVPASGLGSIVADQVGVGFRIFTMDPANPLSSNTWSAVGGASNNGNDNSGRIGGIAVDPSDPSGNTVYIAGASGGIWKTSNFLTTDSVGPTYVPLTSFGPTFAMNIGGIAVFGRNGDPTQSIVFAVTGEGDVGSRGVGLLRSMDGGLTWTLLDSTTNVDASGNPLPISSAQRDHIFVGSYGFKVLVDPKPTPSGDVIVYAALSGPNGGFWRSLDTGKHWQLMQNALANSNQVTDIVFDLNSGTFDAFGHPTGNLQILYAAFRGSGVYSTPDRGQTWNPTNLAVGDPLLRDRTLGANTAVNVAAPVDSPNGAKGRIYLAKPALTGNSVLDLQYQGWLYALVATPGSTLDGIYMTKDFGDNWVKVRVPNAGSPTDAIPSDDISNPDVPVLGGVGGFGGQGNYDMSLAVDPLNPNIIYVGGTLDGPATGFIRVDTTFVHDAHAFYEDNASSGNALQIGVNDPVVLKSWPTSPVARFPNPVQNPYVNLLRDPADPFANSSVNVRYADTFTNTGAGVKWLPFDLEGTDQHRIVTMVDPLTGRTRIIIGDDQGVYSVVDKDGTFQLTYGNQTLPDISRNGNIQITQFYYGAAQPSNLAAQFAGAMFYGQGQDDGFPAAVPDVLDSGNITWIGPEGDGGGVATDQTGSGTLYQYNWPCCGGGITNFFQVNGLGRTQGLLQDSQPGNTPDPQWPFLGVLNFAVNPIAGNQIIISSNAGRIFGTSNTGAFWSVIGNPAALDGTKALALAFGAPDPAGPGGNDATNFFLYVGTTGGKIFVTYNGGGANGNNWRDISTGLDGSNVAAIITNPQRGSHEAYAVTTRGVYHMVDSGSSVATPRWVNITGNLLALTHVPFDVSGLTETQARTLSSIQADWRYAITDSGSVHPLLYVGGEGGVYRSLDNGVNWSLFPDTTINGAAVAGGYLPNAEVSDLDLAVGNIDPTTGRPRVAGSPDVLLATTYGRSSFAIRIAPLILPNTFKLDPTTDRGRSGSDRITNTTQGPIKFLGTSEITAFGNTTTINLYDITDPDNQILVGTGTTDAIGNFSVQVTFLSDGVRTIGAQAVDDAGVVGPMITTTVEIHNTPPAPPSVPDLAASSDLGSSSTDDITKDNTPTFTGTADPGALVEIFADDVLAGSVIASSPGGAYTFTFTTALSDGVHLISAQQTDLAGNVSARPAGLSVTIDTVAPAAPASPPDLIPTSDTGALSTDNITIVRDPTFTGTVEPGAFVQIFVKSATLPGATEQLAGSGFADSITGVYLITVTPGTADGTFNFTAKQTDIAGNTSPASAPLRVTIDTVAEVPTVDLDSASDSGTSSTDDITNDHTPTITGTAEAGALVEIFDGGVSVGSVTAGANRTYSFNFTVPLSDGAHQISAQQSDLAGNPTSDRSAALTVTIDTTAPTVTAASIEAMNGVPFSGVVGHYADANPFGSATISWGDGTANSNGLAVSPGQSSTDITGQHTYNSVSSRLLTVTATDLAGNQGSDSTTITVAPLGPILSLSGPDSGFTGQALTFTISTTHPISQTAAAGFAYTIDWGDGSALETISATPGNGAQFTIDHTFDTAGSFTVHVRATDRDGGTANRSLTVAIAQSPHLQGTAIFNSGQTQRSHIDRIEFTFDGDAPVDSLSLSDLRLLYNGGLEVPLSGASLDYTPSTGRGILDISGLELADGDYQLQIQPAPGIILHIDFFKLRGDVDGNRVVNLTDLAIVNRSFGKSNGQSGFNENADLDSNDTVNVADRVIVRTRLGHRISAGFKRVTIIPGRRVFAPGFYFGLRRLGATVPAFDLVIRNPDPTRTLHLRDLHMIGDDSFFRFAIAGTIWGTTDLDLAPGRTATVRLYMSPSAPVGIKRAKLVCLFNNGSATTYGGAIALLGANVRP